MHKDLYLHLIVGSLIGIVAEPESKNDQFHSFPKTRDEDKCYDGTGRPQVSVISCF